VAVGAIVAEDAATCQIGRTPWAVDLVVTEAAKRG